jgi:hypothetical protein
MKNRVIRRPWFLTAGVVGLALLTTTGCQTWVNGMTLPSGHYLQHPPQFIPEDPQYPLEKELAHQEEDLAAGENGGGGAP